MLRLVQVYLSHISDDSNSEEYAYSFVKNYINENYNDNLDGILPDIDVAKRLEVTEIINSMED